MQNMRRKPTYLLAIINSDALYKGCRTVDA